MKTLQDTQNIVPGKHFIYITESFMVMIFNIMWQIKIKGILRIILPTNLRKLHIALKIFIYHCKRRIKTPFKNW